MTPKMSNWPAPAFLAELSEMDSVEAALRSNSYFDIWTLGLVFVHAKDPQVPKLLDLAQKALAPTRWDVWSHGDDGWREKLDSGPARRSRARVRRIRVFDCCGDSEAAMTAFKLAQRGRGKSGMWVVASPRLLPPGELRKCDAAIFFDMPSSSYEHVRDAMNVDAAQMEELEARSLNTVDAAVLSVTPLHMASYGSYFQPRVLPIFQSDRAAWSTFISPKSGRLGESLAR